MIFRHLVAAVCMLTVVGVAAQTHHRRDSLSTRQAYVREEPQFVDYGPAKRFIEIKPNLAVGTSSILQNYAQVIPGLSDIQMSPGLMVRGGVDVRFALRNCLALGTGLAYESDKSRYAMSIVDNVTGTINSIYVRNSFSQWYVPVYLSWRFNLGRRMRWNVDAGWYFAFANGGKTRVSGYTSGENSLGQPVITHVNFKTDYFTESQPLVNGVKDFDNGLRLATGLTYYRHYSLNMVMGVSAANLSINHNVIDTRYHNFTFAIEMGYNF